MLENKNKKDENEYSQGTDGEEESPEILAKRPGIEIIHFKNREVEEPLLDIISDYYDEVRKLLPELPQTMQIYFDDTTIIPETGLYGFAYSSNIMTLQIDPEFHDKDSQVRNLRPLIFHESMHIRQGYTGDKEPVTAIESAIYEGMATVIERDQCGVWEPWGEYRNLPEENLKKWEKELTKLSIDEFLKNTDDWKFWHHEKQERWIVYKTGMWMVDKVLQKHGLTILDLAPKTAKEVLELYHQSDL